MFVRAQCADQHALPRAGIRLLRRKDSDAHLFGDQSVIVSKPLERAGAKEISAAISDVNQAEPQTFEPGGDHSRAHAVLLRIFLRSRHECADSRDWTASGDILVRSENSGRCELAAEDAARRDGSVQSSTIVSTASSLATSPLASPPIPSETIINWSSGTTRK